MSGARPTGFKKAGGFLNNVDGTWTDYVFTSEAPGGGKRKKGNDFTPLFARITIQVDGADDPVSTSLFAGSADDFEISEDGKSVTPVTEGMGLRGETALAIFIESLIDAGFPENLTEEFYTDSPEFAANYEAALGTRVRLVQVTNEEVTKKLGKKKDPKTGREYERKDLKVQTVLALPGTAAKTTSKVTAAKSGKTSGKVNGKQEVDVTALSDETLLSILHDSDGSVRKGSLIPLIAKKLGVKHPYREEVRRMIYSDDYLNDATERGIIAYDQTDKSQMITATE